MFALRGRLPAVTFAIALSIATQSSAQVARVFLSGTGDDANDCSNAGTPCRSLQGAIDQCPVKGEVIVMTSGGFGTANITKSLTINAPSGIVAFDARTITVNIGATDKVIIRGLTMNGAVFGDTYGIYFTNLGTLVVERSVFAGFLYAIGQAGAGSNLVVNNCDFRNNGIGIFAQLNSGTALTNLTVENSRFVNNVSFGVFLYDYIRAVVKDSVATGNYRGYAIWQSVASDGALLLDGCVSAHNTTGVYARGDNQIVATAKVTNCTIVGNATGVLAELAGQVISFGNNQLWANTADGTFNSTAAQQ